MVRLEVWDKKPEVVGEVVTLRLRKDEGSGHVSVCAVDRCGNIIPPCLAIFTADGGIWRLEGVDPKLGFQLDEKRRIKLKFEGDE